MTTDEGLTAGTQAWLAGAGQRLNEPVREDRREDVQARIDALDPPSAETRATGLQRREELDSWLRRCGFHPSDAVKAALAVANAGWKHPDKVAAMVAAVRAETAERIAAELDRFADTCDESRADQTSGQVAASVGAAVYRRAARIAREMR